MAVTDDEKSLYPRVLAAVGEALEWDFGALWEAAPDGDAVVCVEAWSGSGFEAGDFTEVTRATRFEPGVGLPGRVWRSGEAAWVADLPEATNFPRAPAATEAGLHAAFGFP